MLKDSWKQGSISVYVLHRSPIRAHEKDFWLTFQWLSQCTAVAILSQDWGTPLYCSSVWHCRGKAQRIMKLYFFHNMCSSVPLIHVIITCLLKHQSTRPIVKKVWIQHNRHALVSISCTKAHMNKGWSSWKAQWRSLKHWNCSLKLFCSCKWYTMAGFYCLLLFFFVSFPNPLSHLGKLSYRLLSSFKPPARTAKASPDSCVFYECIKNYQTPGGSKTQCNVQTCISASHSHTYFHIFCQHLLISLKMIN